jgi:hypothetical protein
MRFGRKNQDENAGTIDGGEGRGIPLPEDDDEAIVDDDVDAFAVLDDDDDANPGDRRRDPLRRH